MDNFAVLLSSSKRRPQGIRADSIGTSLSVSQGLVFLVFLGLGIAAVRVFSRLEWNSRDNLMVSAAIARLDQCRRPFLSSLASLG